MEIVTSRMISAKPDGCLRIRAQNLKTRIMHIIIMGNWHKMMGNWINSHFQIVAFRSYEVTDCLDAGQLTRAPVSRPGRMSGAATAHEAAVNALLM
jgi:hypothetical protein